MIKADKQETFNIVYKHLLAQGKRAMSGERSESGKEMCAYLAADGSKCAIGCMIPDGHPAQKSRDSVMSLVTEYPDLFEPGCSDWFLCDLQGAHDSAYDNDFLPELLRVANNYRLKVPE